MATDYTQDAKDALADIGEAGIDVTLTRKMPRVVEPINGTIRNGVDFQMTLSGIVKSPKTFRGNTGYDQTLEEASRLGRAKVFQCGAYGLASYPQGGDLVVINSITYKVHAVTTLQPGNVPILHSLTLIQQ